MKHSFNVTVRSNASPSAVQEYVRDAVSNWNGAMPPQDPLFDICRAKVTVRPTKPGALPKQCRYGYCLYGQLRGRAVREMPPHDARADRNG